MTTDESADARLFAQLRAVWEEVDPMPAGLVDRMVAAVAVEDLSREYALLTLVEGTLAATRGDADTATLQFSDGRTNVLLHVSVADDGRRRVDGWVDAEPLSIRLVQEAREWTTEAGEHGRFAFVDVPPGLTRLRLSLPPAPGETGPGEFQTPQFEI
ncbi:hypothetical protein [Microbacterium invictum]|uniref:Uncharacterized protein n=1 Tax=Microbacterium invictum TaxID=515415 RepID=A0ABZ0VB16_9MICO|nr:hypothetical protein [Microbacterium invictum]WQB70826.1 hypothetical protein T9R20_02390 [Microbacterium invictum]